MGFQQRQPFIHQCIFSSRGGFLFEEYGADGLLGNAAVFLTQESKRFLVKVFEGPSVELTDVALRPSRASDTVRKALCARLADEREQIIFPFEKNDAAQQPLRLRQ